MKFEIDFVESYSRENIIRELQRLAAALGKNTLSHRDIDAHGRISSPVVGTRFGSLRNALLEAGLKPCRYQVSDQELCSLLVEVWTRTLENYGRSPMRHDLRAFGCAVHPSTFANRFGSWNKALLAAAEFMPASVASAPAPPPPSPTASQRRKRISIRKRFFVLKRDHYRCCMCKRTGIELEVDHKVPVAQGGSDALDNLQTLCSDCNGGKSDSSE